MITLWLDEEWTPLEVHQRLGKAAAKAYAALRQQGGWQAVSAYDAACVPEAAAAHLRHGCWIDDGSVKAADVCSACSQLRGHVV